MAELNEETVKTILLEAFQIIYLKIQQSTEALHVPCYIYFLKFLFVVQAINMRWHIGLVFDINQIIYLLCLISVLTYPKEYKTKSL